MEKILYHNARIQTQDSHQAMADAMVTEGGKIIAVGKKNEVRALGSFDREVDMFQRTILPGFNDAHVHLWKVGQLASFIVDLRGVKSIGELQAKVRASAAKINGGYWVLGRGFNEQLMKERRLPTLDEMDAISTDHPVYLIRTCAHIAVVNRLALKHSQVNDETLAPQGGVIGKDGSGHLSGAFYETALGLVTRHIPAPSQTDYQNMIYEGINLMLSKGITSITDPAVHPELLDAYFDYCIKQDPGIRLNILPILLPDGGDKPYPIPAIFRSDFLTIDTVKFFADGGLSGKTASTSRPYLHSNDHGILRLEQSYFYKLASDAQLKGFRIATHAIGDKAIELVLDVYKQLYTLYGDTRNRLEHFGLPTVRHIETLAVYRFVAVTQPVFLYELGENFIEALDDQYLSFCYPVKSLLDKNIPVALSTDGPVVSNLNPWSNIKYSLQRKTRLDKSIAPGESITLQQAIYAYTVGSAYAEGKEARKGKIASGFMADFIVVDRDPFQVETEDLDKIEVIETYVNGECRWRNKII